MNKNMFLILGVCILLVGAFTVIDFDKEEAMKFNPCDEQPLFGLKYNNCDSIECINFYENIKSDIRGDCE
jgi:hypothetical protein